MYSSAGFGGGSSYLALLSLSALPYTEFRFIALACNIVVVATTSYLFYRSKMISFRKIWPLLFCSVPMAFLGGTILLQERLFFLLLATFLGVSSMAMIVRKPNETVYQSSAKANGLIGGGIGFLSGLIGIGGGIILSPILHLTNWDTAKRISGATAFFILVNSIAGLAGQFSKEISFSNGTTLVFLVLAVGLGGQLGGRLNLHFLKPKMIRRLSAFIILVVALRIFYKYLII